MSTDPNTRQLIEDVLRNNRVVLFMKGHRVKPECGFSAKAVAALDLLVPDYLTINVLEHPEIREGIKAYGNWPTIPQLYVKGELVGGSDIILEMMDSGELADLLDVQPGEAPPPRIEIAEAAATVMRNAAGQRAGMDVRLRIDATWHHTLSLGPSAEPDLRIATGGVELVMDRWTASRADGLRIRMEESLAGTRFDFDNPNAPPPVRQMSVQALKEKLDRREPLQLIDVRGEDERAVASLPGARAWSEETDRYLDTLPRDTQIVLHCHRGGRSQQAAEYLRGRGFTNVHNVAGGIDAWSREIDSAVPRY
jgi:monothiol glutaredoxin